MKWILKNVFKLLIVPLLMMTVEGCVDNENLGSDCTTDSDCTTGNVCTVTSTIDKCEGQDPDSCIDELTNPGNFAMDRSIGTCYELRAQSDCKIRRCSEGEVCIYFGGLSDYDCHAKYEQRIDGFPCHDDSVCASGSCSIVAFQLDNPVGVCITQMTSTE